MTSYADLSVVVEGLHDGSIQKLVQKPIDTQEFLAAIMSDRIMRCVDSVDRERLEGAG